MRNIFSRWNQGVTTEVTNAILKDFALRILLPRISEGSTRDHLERCLARDDYRNISCCANYIPAITKPDELIAYRQILALFQKREDLDMGIDRREAAMESFLESERRCAVTNETFKKWGRGFLFPRHVDSVFHTASRKISRVLGDVPPLSDLRMRFGPGATRGLAKKNANALEKLRSSWACSEDLAGTVQNVLEEVPPWVFPHWDDSESAKVTVEIQNGKLCFVPKNFKTDRSIVTEPLLNTFVQAGIGDYMVRRLRSSGLDLTDQSRNQSLARIGSITRGVATLDLSSASDSVSTELVAHLLPLPWFEFLSQCRTRCIETPFGVMRQEKFCSMGNGFTFPLESLIFWTLALAVCEYLDLSTEDVSVYGDDIIVPTAAVPLLTQVLTSAGFVLNKDKSYVDGPFRESCGKDYLSGILVRPVYVKEALTGEGSFRLRNFFYRNYDEESAAFFEDLIDPELRIYGPDGYGDGHLIKVPFVGTPYKRVHGYGGFTFETYQHVTRRRLYELQPGDYAFPLYTVYLSRGDGSGEEFKQRKDGKISVSLPGTSRAYKRTKIYVLSV